MILFILIELGLLIFLILYSLSIYSAFIGAPYFITPKKALEEIFEIAAIKPSDNFYDLGAGDGRALIMAEKKYGAKAIGFELAPLVYLLARLNMFFKRTRNAKLYFRNFYKQNLSDADVIFCFLSIHAMEKLKSKFERELKPGTKIISYSFSLHGWEPKRVITSYPGKVYLYEV